MALTVKHAYTSPVPDDGVPSEVGPSEWNSPHVVTGVPDAAGTDMQVLFNNAGVQGGDAGFLYNKNTNNLALGTGFAPWRDDATESVFMVGPALHLRGGAGATAEFGSNLYFDGTNWKYRTDGLGALLQLTNGILYVYQAPSGTAGGNAVLANIFRVNAPGHVTFAGNAISGGGSASSPAFTSSADSTSGLYLPGAGAVGITVSGSLFVGMTSTYVALKNNVALSWYDGAYSTIVTRLVNEAGGTVGLTDGQGNYGTFKAGLLSSLGNATVAGALTVGGNLTAGSITLNPGSQALLIGGTNNLASYTGSPLEVRATNGTTAAAMTFHVPGVFAGFFGIDTDAQLKVGGYSWGANAYRVHHDQWCYGWPYDPADGYHLKSDRNVILGYLTANGGATLKGTTTCDYITVGGSVTSYHFIANGNLSVAGTGLVTGAFTTTSDMTIQRSAGAATGLIFWGNTGAKYQYWDGNQWVFQGGGVYTTGGLTVQAGAAITGNVQVTGAMGVSGALNANAFWPYPRYEYTGSSILTLDWNSGQSQMFTLNGYTDIVVNGNIPLGCMMRLVISTGGNGCTFGANGGLVWYWPMGVAPVVNAGPIKWVLLSVYRVNSGAVFANASVY